MLFILTFWGTVYQVEHGLYAAQEKFFNTLWFSFGVIPFPGARLVLWVLFINLCMAFPRIFKTLKRKGSMWRHLGLIIVHSGLLLFFVSAFVTFHLTIESNVTLSEGGKSNTSDAYSDWELILWPAKGGKIKAKTFDSNEFHSGTNLSAYGLSIKVDKYYLNCEAYLAANPQEKIDFINASNIQKLKVKASNKEPENNLPGGIFQVQSNDKEKINLILYGGEGIPTEIKSEGKAYFIMLQRKKHSLPFTLTLKDFMMEKHPNTEIPRSFKSLVEIKTEQGIIRDVLISMNEPLRYKNFTFYQASYIIDENGREYSTLAVVKNTGRLLPYIASGVVVLGLMWHFIMMAFKRKNG